MILGPNGKPAIEVVPARGAGIEELATVAERRHDVKVTRSFSFKMNLGTYESADFFCSQQADCAAADADSVSADLYEFCMDEVMKAVVDLKRRRTAKEADREQRRNAA